MGGAGRGRALGHVALRVSRGNAGARDTGAALPPGAHGVHPAPVYAALDACGWERVWGCVCWWAGGKGEAGARLGR